MEVSARAMELARLSSILETSLALGRHSCIIIYKEDSIRVFYRLEA